MNRLKNAAAGLAACICMALPAAAFAQQFDPQTLQRLGISPEAAAYFSKTARFLPGTSRVRLRVNGVDQGTMDVRFNEEGTLCFTPELLRRVGLKVPDGTSEESCQDYRKAYPETDITQLPNQSQVDIVTPLSARAPAEEAVQGQYVSGGTAALINYNLSGSRSGGGDSGYQYLRAYSETGLNVADWILRSRQDYYSQGGRATFTQGDTYAQHAVPSLRATFQAGQISPAGSLFAVGTLRGAQLFPEYALRQTQASGVGFNGITSGPSRIEVRQMGTLILMTQVPAGAYTISDVPIISGNSDLDVQVISTSGERQQFIVPAASFGAVRNATAQGLSVAIGRYQAYRNSDSETPLVATASNGWTLGRRASLNAGALVSPSYRALAATLTASPSEAINGSIGIRASSATATGQKLQGQQITSTLSVSPMDRLSTNFSATWQTEGYRDLAQVLQRVEDPRAGARASQTYTAGVSWFQPTLGALSATYAASRLSGLDATRQRATLSWNRSFGRTSVTLSAAKDLSADTRARSDNQYFLTLSFPLGSASAGVYVSKAGDSSAVGASYSETVNPQLSYNLSSSMANPGRAVNSSIAIDALPRYARVNLSANRDAQGSLSTNWGVQGSVVAAGGAVAFSPYEVGDTFGIAEVGDLAGVQIQTPAGPAWTDAWGHAVIPGLPAYSESSVEINTASLPRNANLPNGVQSVKPARGAVQVVDFNLRQVQRYLLSAVSEADQQPLAERLAVMDGRGNLVTLVGRHGQIFLDDAYAAPLQVALKDGGKCFLDFQPSDKPDPDRPYEDARAVCRAAPPAAS
ncbi:fimbria/pilus outer membrane usher protein [Achromobacter ruhlandii]|uniref:fimbria/pilus outer membrane usher protein n=1 Tax=Achromobacter ruhlandii TaxID=72557 RepID=UPI002DBDC9C6|nr:fimbria/pilus outer membrane usher protein [Achromobacter ruhlandii]MEB6664665.1 fimbria/pilus outer membrane usher protein [Achromobacter ruhlandii]